MKSKIVVLLSSMLLLLGFASAQTIPDPLLVKPRMDENGVDRVTGGLQFAVTDVSIGPIGGGGLAFSRTYFYSPFGGGGEGWRPSTMSTVTRDGGTGDYVVTIGSSGESFSLTGALGTGTFDSNSGSGATLTYSSSTLKYTFTNRFGTAYTFDTAVPKYPAKAVLTESVDPNGVHTKYNYSVKTAGGTTKARIQSVTNNYGYQLHFDYARPSDPSASADFWDWQKTTKVTAINRAVDWCGDLQVTCSYSTTWPSASYTYTSPSVKIETVTDSLNRTTTYGYRFGDGLGELSSVKWPGSSSNNITFGYQLVTVAVGTITVIHTVNRGYGTWTYKFSQDSGEKFRSNATDPSGKENIVNSEAGIIKSVIDELSRTTTYARDSLNRVTRVTLPEENYVQFVYDARGNKTETRMVAKSGSGLSDIVSSASYPSTCTNIKTCNKPSSTTDERGKVTDVTYNATHGNVLSITLPDPDGAGALVRPQKRFTYAQKQARYKDGVSSYANGAAIYVPTNTSECATTSSCANGADETKTTVGWPTTSSPNNLRPTFTTTAAGNGTLSSTISYTYDDFGNLTTEDGPLSGAADTTRYRYDAAFQVVGIVGPDPDGGGALKHRAIRTNYNSYGQPTTVEMGIVSSQSDADWTAFTALQKSETVYDTHGRSTQKRAYSGSTSTKLAVLQTSYDLVGRMQCTALRMNPSLFGSLPASACALGTEGSEGPDRITKITYDAGSRPLAAIAAFGTSLQQNVMTRTYTTNGQLSTLVDASGNKTTYEYDGFDRLKKIRYPHPTTAGASSITDYEEYTYDAGGNITVARLRDGTSYSYTYDNLSRLTNSNAPGSTLDVVLSYDSFDRTTSLSQTGHTLTYSYDQLSRLKSETQPLGSVLYEYDVAGRRTKLTWPGSYFVEYDWNVADSLTKIRENGASSGVGVLVSYAYDDLGRRTSVSRGNGVPSSFGYDSGSRLSSLSHDASGTMQDEIWAFAYNSASQLVSKSSSNSVFDWSPSTNFTDNYTDNGLNQIVTAAGASFTHDARGNMTNDGTKSYGYDAADRLISAGSATQSYDPADRLYQAVGTATTRFLYDGIDVIAEYDGSNNLLRRYVHGAGTNEPAVWLEGTGTSDRRWLLSDRLGSIVALSNSAGAITNVNTYSEYGVPSGSNLGRFQYTGQMWMPETGLYHYKARDYHPAAGRFMQADPIGYDGGMNLYAYVQNDPINLVDPFGFTGTSGDTMQRDIDHGAFDQDLDFNQDLIEVLGVRRRKPGSNGYRYSRYELQNILTDGIHDYLNEKCDIYCDDVDAGFRLVVFDYKAEGSDLVLEIVMIIPVAKAGKLLKLGKIVCCFTEGTLVATAEGLRPIEEIAVGDLVWARDPDTGETALKPVTELVPGHHREVWEVVIKRNGPDGAAVEETISTTNDHPWGTPDRNWIETEDLSPGQKIALRDGAAGTVLIVSNTGRTENTYNLEVADFHTYFVGEAELWVHNTCLLVGISKKGTKHLSKHLGEFQKLDPSFTLEKQIAIGRSIASNSANLVKSSNGSRTYQSVVEIGGQNITVTAVVNASNNLRSVFPRF